MVRNYSDIAHPGLWDPGVINAHEIPQAAVPSEFCTI